MYLGTFSVFVILMFLVISVRAQADEVCREFGETPSREFGTNRRLVPYIYGRIIIKGLDSTAKLPRVTAIFSDSAQTGVRQVLGKSGNYCFKKLGSGATLIVDIDGLEIARRTFTDLGARQQREDLEIYPQQTSQTLPPGVISVKPSRPPNEKTTGLYKQAAEAEREKQPENAIKFVKEIVAIDPSDFIAWTKLGSLHISVNSNSDAEIAFKSALAAKADYAPALVNYGILKAVQREYPVAIDLFERAVKAEPDSARGYRFLGEAYLQNRQGTLGLAALDKALSLDPVGMAECHLLKARLYDLVGAKKLAAAEYKQFIKKVPDHPDKKQYEKYIKQNPISAND